MVLKKVEICGFKSFPDKTILDFPDGITGIVGSNGCGKSNVSDAIRWVLGEQSAKSLRGEKMEDLIFAGTSNRKPMGFAEVILTFDNTKKLFPLEYTEVSIGRRLFRDGQSCYLLNKQECRLRDIYDLLMDSGIGRRAHAIIEQGAIEEIIMAKPEERRQLIEEAAGIAKYRSRRAEALRRLESTREGLQRVDDLISEMDRQEQSLKRQSKKAERYREIEIDLKNFDIALASLKIKEIDEKISEMSETRRKLTDRLTELEVESSRTALEIEELKTKLELERNAVRDSGRKLSESEKTYSAAESKLVELKARQTDDEDAINRLNNELESLNSRISESEALKQSAISEISGYDERLHSLATNLSETELVSNGCKEEITAANANFSSCSEELRHYSEKAVKFESELIYSTKKAEELEKEIVKLSAESERMIAEQNDILYNIAEWNREKNELGSARSQMMFERANVENKISEIKNELERSALEHSSLGRKLENLSTRLENARSSTEMTAEELSKASQSTGIELKAIADLKLTLPEYSVPVLAALNEIRNGVLAEEASVESSKVVAEKLRGRAVLGLQREIIEEWRAKEGLTPLYSLLLPTAPPALKTALSGWYLALTAEDALKILPLLDERERIVTINGDIYYSFGAVKIQREEELDATAVSMNMLEEESNLIREKLLSIESEIEKNRAELLSLEEKLKFISGEINSNDTRTIELSTRIEAENNRLSRLDISKLEEDSMKIKEDLDITNKVRENLKTELISVQNFSKAFEVRVEEARTAMKELEQKGEEVRERISSLKREIATMEERRLSRIRESERFTQWIEESRSAMTRYSEMRDEIVSRREERVSVIEQLNLETGSLAAELETRKNEFVRLEASSKELDSELNERESKFNSINREREDRRNELHGQDVLEVQLSSEKGVILGRVSEKYGECDLNAVAIPESNSAESNGAESNGSQMDIDAISARIEELKEMMKRLGGINFAAAEELGEVTNRLEFYRTQREDLSRAESGLTEVVRDIDKQTKTLFIETFNAVNSNFNLLFNRLFGSTSDTQGSAELVLLDPDNPLESGIDILAMPPGKKLQTISLLSGGEKALTAVSLLFSIFLVRPSPFAVLDELDASMDEANVGKYVQLLKEFSLRSQFIIITHNKRTMEAANTLYGVTQTEKGISRLIGVRMDEYEALPEAAG